MSTSEFHVFIVSGLSTWKLSLIRTQIVGGVLCTWPREATVAAMDSELPASGSMLGPEDYTSRAPSTGMEIIWLTRMTGLFCLGTTGRDLKSRNSAPKEKPLVNIPLGWTAPSGLHWSTNSHSPSMTLLSMLEIRGTHQVELKYLIFVKRNLIK